MNIEHISPLVMSISFGGMVGFLIGYAIKKIMKVLAVGVGIFFAALMYLEFQNIVNINWDKLQTASQSAVSTLSNAAGQIPFISTPNNFAIPLTSSMAMGFTIGFIRG